MGSMSGEVDATPSRDELSSTGAVDEPEDQIFRKYYTDKDYLLSPEGLLKLLSAIVCVVSAVLVVNAARCGLEGGAAGAALAVGAACSLLYVAAALGLPLYAPQAFLFTDIVLSTVMGVLLLITGVLSMTLCEFTGALSYVHGPLAVVNAGMVTASAVITYIGVMRLWDKARLAVEPPRPAPAEQEV